MKKSLFLRLCLLIVVVLSIYSCRTEVFETGNEDENVEKHFIIKQISQSEIQQIPGLLQKTQHFAKSKTKTSSLSAKGVYTNTEEGFSINTDDALMIIDKANVKTYTFRIYRGKPNPDLLENLVLTERSEGMYEALIYQYNKTKLQAHYATKEELEVGVKDNVTILNLGNQTGEGIFSKENICLMPVPEWTTMPGHSCDSGAHEFGESCTLSGGDLPTPGTTIFSWVLTSVDCSTNPVYNGSSGSTGPYNGGHGGFDSGINDLDTPCTKLATNLSKVNSIIQKPKFIGRLNEISDNILTNSLEKAFSFGTSTANPNEEAVTPVKIGDNTGVNIAVNYTGVNVQGGIHTHPKKNAEYKSFSFRDVFIFGEANSINSSFQHYLVKAYDGTMYALTINNPNAFSLFFSNHNISYYVNAENTHDITTNIGGDIEDVIFDLKKQGKTKDEAYEAALAMVMKKYDMGISISKKDGDGSFIPIFVNDLTPDPNKPKKKTYEITNDCNLN